MSLWSRLIGRKPRFIPPEMPVRDTWRRGDLGECIGTTPWIDAYDGERSQGPEPGQIIRVAHVHMRDGYIYLIIEGDPRTGHEAGAFRKIVQAQDEACEGAFAKLIRRKRVRA